MAFAHATDERNLILVLDLETGMQDGGSRKVGRFYFYGCFSVGMREYDGTYNSLVHFVCCSICFFHLF